MHLPRAFEQAMLGGSIVSVAARTSLFAAGDECADASAGLRDLPRRPGQDNIDDVIRALKASGISDIELSSFQVEPAHSPRRWRVKTDVEWYGRIKKRLDAAGIVVHAYAVGYDEQFTDEEIQATFRMPAAFGARVISFPASLEVARRLIPFRNAFAIGGSDDPVAAVREYQLRSSRILVRDRTRNDGRSEEFGVGDTPIAEVLGLLRKMRSSIPVFADDDYVGPDTPLDEVLRCTQYVAQVLH